MSVSLKPMRLNQRMQTLAQQFLTWFWQNPNQHLVYGYFWREITKNFLFEVLLIAWPPNTSSGIHDHGSAWGVSFPLPLSQTDGIIGQIYRVQHDQFICVREDQFRAGQAHWVSPHQLHRMANPSETDTVVTLHIYFPRRKKSQPLLEPALALPPFAARSGVGLVHLPLTVLKDSDSVFCSSQKALSYAF